MRQARPTSKLNGPNNNTLLEKFEVDFGSDIAFAFTDRAPATIRLGRHSFNLSQFFQQSFANTSLHAAGWSTNVPTNLKQARRRFSMMLRKILLLALAGSLSLAS